MMSAKDVIDLTMDEFEVDSPTEQMIERKPSLLSNKPIKADPSAAANLCSPLMCPICTEFRPFESFDQLEIHICLDHIQWCRYECVLCPYARFPTEHTVHLHFTQAHGGIEPKVVQTLNVSKLEYLRSTLQTAMDRLSVVSSAEAVGVSPWRSTPLPGRGSASLYPLPTVAETTAQDTLQQQHDASSSYSSAWTATTPSSANDRGDTAILTPPGGGRTIQPDFRARTPPPHHFFVAATTSSVAGQRHTSTPLNTLADKADSKVGLKSDFQRITLPKALISASPVLGSLTTDDGVRETDAKRRDRGGRFAPRKSKTEPLEVQTTDDNGGDLSSLSNTTSSKGSGKQKKKTAGTCQLCQRNVVWRSSIPDHVWKYHMPTPRLQCQYCDFNENHSAQKLEKHMLSNHEGVKANIVDNLKEMKDEFHAQVKACGFPVSDRVNNLTEENSELCTICENRFKVSSAKGHASTLHLDEKRYRCEECGAMTSDPQTAKNHEQKHHGQAESLVVTTDRFADELADEVAAVCRKAFPTIFSEFAHERTAAKSQQKSLKKKNDENSSICVMCDPPVRHFNLRARAHVWTHTEEKRYHCAECGKWFLDWRSLRIHIRVFHTDTMPLDDRPKLRAHLAALGKQCFPNLTLFSKAGMKSGQKKDKPLPMNLCCVQCNIEVKTASAMTTHVYQHLAKDFGRSRVACTVDNCSFKTVTRLQIFLHLNAYHKSIIGAPARSVQNCSDFFVDFEDELKEQFEQVKNECFPTE